MKSKTNQMIIKIIIQKGKAIKIMKAIKKKMKIYNHKTIIIIHKPQNN